MRGKIHVFPMMTLKPKCGEKGKQEPTLEWVASRVPEVKKFIQPFKT